MACSTVFTVLLLAPAISYADMSLDPKYSELEQKYNMVVDEVMDLRKSMKTMNDDIKRVRKISRALDALCEELHSEEEKPGIPEREEPTPKHSVTEPGIASEPDFQTSVHVTSVLHHGDTFQVEYNSTGKAEVGVSDWDRDWNSTLSDSFSEGNGFVNVSSVSKWSAVSLKVDKYTAFVYLNERSDTNISTPRLDMGTDVQNDIVIEPGRTREIKVWISKIQSENYSLEFKYGMAVISRKERETVISTRDTLPGIVNKTRVAEYLSHKEITLTINENKEDYEGMLKLQVKARSKRPSLVPRFTLFHTLTVRKPYHIKPYPEGFLGFMVYRDVTIINRCHEWSDCVVHSVIVGNDPEDITLWKLTGNRIYRVIVPRKKFPYENTLSVHFRIGNISKADAGKYMFRGTSRWGTVIEKEFEITVIVPYVILREKSEIVKDTSVKLVVRCTGRGYPDPQIRFYKGSNYSKGLEITGGRGISIETIMVSEEDIIATLTLNTKAINMKQIYCELTPNNSDNPYDRFLVYDESEG